MKTPPREARLNGDTEAELFREQAIVAAAGSQLGDPLETYWRGVTWFIALAAGLLAALALMLALVTYSPMHRVPAFVDVPDGLVRIGAPADGRVRRISVKEGALVQAGDVLAVLNSDVFGSNGGSRRSTLQSGLAVEQASLAKEIDIARREATTRKAWTDRMSAGMRAERSALLADLRAGSALLVSLRDQSGQVAEAAEKGYVSKIEAARKRDDLLVQEGRLAISRGAIARIERDIDAISLDARIADAKLEALIESRQRASDSLGRTSQVAALEAEQVIRAPAAGIVSSALVAPGQSVVLGQPLFTLAEKGSPLIVRLLVPPRAAATVRRSMRIRVSFSAYPREKFGDFEARIVDVSATPLRPSELDAFSTVSEPAYLATSMLTAPPRGPDNSALALKPGMLAIALVPVEERSAMEWLLDPLIRGFSDSTGQLPTPGKR